MKIKSVRLTLAFTAVCLGLAGWFGTAQHNGLLAASGASIGGIVKDDAGKPLRAAKITASLGYKSVTRFSDNAGHYKITGLTPGTYEISATAWGYERKQNTQDLSSAADMNFTLAPQWNIHQLSTADWLSALPENEETLELRATCIKCHNLSYMIRNRGLTAEEWTNRILNMSPGKTYVTPKVTYAQAEKLGAILGKYLGPDSAPPTREQVHHTEISEAALGATFTEYTVPTHSYIHTIKPDPDGKYIWFTEFDNYSKKLGRFDIAKQEFLEIQLPAAASSFAVGKDGKVWLEAGHNLYEVDAFGKLTDVTPQGNGGGLAEAGGEGARTMEVDSAGNVWLVGGLRVVKFDPRADTYEQFPLPKVTAIPDDYYRNLLNVRADGQKEFGYGTYALTVDGHDNIWYSAYDVGYVGRLNPRTKESTMYQVPGSLWIKGLAVDSHGIVWFGNFLHGTVGELDPKTGQVQQYQSPTHFSAFYTPVVDKNGDIWVSDFIGSKLTRFDPKTKQFTEFPMPEPDGMTRFFGLDARGRVWYTDFQGGKIGVLDPGR